MFKKIILFLIPLLLSGCPGLVTVPLTHGEPTWLVLKCKYSDTPGLPDGADQKIEDLFHGSEGVESYFRTSSRGRFRPSFWISPEWRVMDVSVAQDRLENFSRPQRIAACMSAHGVSQNASLGGIVALINAETDGGHNGQVLAPPSGWNVTYLAHEIFHHLGLSHSFSTSLDQIYSWSQPGEYLDPWDIMSAMRVPTFLNAEGIMSGPDATLLQKIQLGWLNEGSDYTVWDVTAEPVQNRFLEREFQIAAYQSQGDATGAVGACIDAPILPTYAASRRPQGEDPNLPVIYRFCVEYRRKQGFDRPLPYESVLVHLRRVRGGFTPVTIPEFSNLVSTEDSYLNGEFWLQISLIEDLQGQERARVRVKVWH